MTMIYEMRVYTAKPGKLKALALRFRNHTLRLFDRHGIHAPHVFVSKETEDQLWYITEFSDEDARQAAWERFQADPEWQHIKRESEADGPLLDSQSVTLLTRI